MQGQDRSTKDFSANATLGAAISPGTRKTRRRKTRFDYFGGLPRLAKTTPRSSAEQRSALASLRASLRSGPGAI
jgi:hypothetical protein